MLQSKLVLSILDYMIQECIKSGRVGIAIPLSDHKRWLDCPNTTFHRAVKSLKESGTIQQVARDRYMLGVWAIDLVESWGN